MEPRQFLTREGWEAAGEAREKLPLRKLMPCQIKIGPVDSATGMNDIDFIISTGALDRERDMISVDGWELDNYLTNPVVLWAHDYSIPPIGRATSVKVKGKRLVARDRFTPEDINPFGAMIYRMLKGGFLNATSVGFQPIDWTYSEEHGGYDFLRNELLEHSVVPVPANPEALMQASKSGIDLRPMRNWVQRFLDNDPVIRHFGIVPRELAEQAWKELRNVDGAEIPQITSGYFSFNEPTSGGVSADSVTITTSDGTSWTGDDYNSASPHWYPVEVRDFDPDWWVREIDHATNNETEAAMDEAIKELIEAITSLREDLTKFTDAMTAKAPEGDPDPEPASDELTADDLKSLVRDTVMEVMTATTGALPE